MNKKIIFGVFFILLLLAGPFVSTSSGFLYRPMNKNISATDVDTPVPFWFLCYVNTSGYGYAVHSGNNMFIAIEYDEVNPRANTSVRSFLKETTINGTHNIQFFFLIGESNLPASGMKGEVQISGMALMAHIW